MVTAKMLARPQASACSFGLNGSRLLLVCTKRQSANVWWKESGRAWDPKSVFFESYCMFTLEDGLARLAIVNQIDSIKERRAGFSISLPGHWRLATSESRSHIISFCDESAKEMFLNLATSRLVLGMHEVAPWWEQTRCREPLMSR
jgi:hypothetical protein